MIASIYLLGTGAAMPINRGLPCIALRCDSDIYLFDVGEGCQYRLFRSGLSLLKVKTIFITHLHGDHYLGLFGMLQSMHLSNRREKLIIYAPNNLGELLKWYFEKKLINVSYPIVFRGIGEGGIYEDNRLIVEAFPVEHGVEAYGFKIRLKDNRGTTIVYTGDTRPCRRIVEESKGAHILIHESTFTSDMAEEAYVQGHSTARDAALSASKAGVDLLVLTHISARYSDPLVLFYDAYRYFKNTIVAEDYMVIRL